MATQKFISLECDLQYKGCQKEDGTQTHSMVVDGNQIEFEACPHCWEGVCSMFTEISKAGRPPAKIVKVSQAKKVAAFPGQPWKFTAHALERMGQRHITPERACKAADNPELTRGGRDAATQIRVRRGIKVTVNEAKNLIITVAKESEEDEQVA